MAPINMEDIASKLKSIAYNKDQSALTSFLQQLFEQHGATVETDDPRRNSIVLSHDFAYQIRSRGPDVALGALKSTLQGLTAAGEARSGGFLNSVRSKARDLFKRKENSASPTGTSGVQVTTNVNVAPVSPQVTIRQAAPVAVSSAKAASKDDAASKELAKEEIEKIEKKADKALAEAEKAEDMAKAGTAPPRKKWSGDVGAEALLNAAVSTGGEAHLAKEAAKAAPKEAATSSSKIGVVSDGVAGPETLKANAPMAKPASGVSVSVATATTAGAVDERERIKAARAERKAQERAAKQARNAQKQSMHGSRDYSPMLRTEGKPVGFFKGTFMLFLLLLLFWFLLTGGTG